MCPYDGRTWTLASVRSCVGGGVAEQAGLNVGATRFQAVATVAVQTLSGLQSLHTCTVNKSQPALSGTQHPFEWHDPGAAENYKPVQCAVAALRRRGWNNRSE